MREGIGLVRGYADPRLFAQLTAAEFPKIFNAEPQ